MTAMATNSSDPAIPRNPSLPGLEGNQGLDDELSSALKKKGSEYAARSHHLLPNGKPKFSNRLILEESPYLLQHAHNPVNWFPWGDEAFERAREQHLPILLSIGYSTCHWCHVMERESFEDIEIARFINQNFIAIKVDREERPDVDAVYMDVLHMLRGRGGWPLTMVLTPEKQAFFGGTYFPPRDGARGRSKGFLSILKEISESYQKDPADLVERAREISQRLNQQAQAKRPGKVPGVEVIERAVTRLRRNFDERWGGFGKAPKFPRPSNFDLLLRWSRRSSKQDERRWARQAVEITLERMLEGGIHDHVGGGFHRYSTDQRWLVPHFEKMLYDNAQLAVSYLEAFQASESPERKKRFSALVHEILNYLDKEMSDPEGGFYSATDADSENPQTGHQDEGWFFTWTPQELREALGEESANKVIKYFGVREKGNFEGRTILHLPSRLRADESTSFDLDTDFGAKWPKIREQLAQARRKRPAPLRDEKVLAAWNGLALSAFSRAALVFDDAAFRTRAERLGTFLISEIRAKDRRLHRMWIAGRAKGMAVLDDYVFVIQGFLDLYESSNEIRWLRRAIELQEVLNEHYRDSHLGGYFSTADDGEELLLRQKEEYDGALPAGNSTAALNLLRLHQLTDRDEFRQQAVGVFSSYSRNLVRSPSSLPKMLASLDFYLDKAQQIFLILPNDGSGSENEVKPFREVLSRHYFPNRVLSVVPESKVAEYSGQIPALEGKVSRKDSVTAYVCEEGLCQQPVVTAKDFEKQVRALQTRSIIKDEE